MKMNAVWYAVSRWEEAKRFYGELLALKQTFCNDEAGWVAYETGAVPLFLVRKPERAGVPGGATVTLECPDLGAMEARLRAAGVRLEDGSQPKIRLLVAYDPDGNTIELSTPVGGERQ